MSDRDAIAELVDLARKELPLRTRAYEDLVRVIYPDLRRLAFSILGNVEDAEQVVQDSLIRVYHGLPKLKEVAAFRGWLARIVANTARSFLSKEIREREKTQRAAIEFDESFEPRDTLPAFSTLIEGLDPTDRTILAMRFVEEMEFNEIAQVLDIGLSRTKMRYYRAIEKLKPKD